MYEEDDYYYFGDFMDTASFTFEENAAIYWFVNFTEPLTM